MVSLFWPYDSVHVRPEDHAFDAFKNVHIMFYLSDVPTGVLWNSLRTRPAKRHTDPTNRDNTTFDTSGNRAQSPDAVFRDRERNA